MARGLDQGLVAAQFGLQVEQTEALDSAPGGPSMPSGSRDLPAQHLVAAAEAEEPAAAAQVRADVDVPALRPHHGKVGEGRLGAGQDHQVGIARQGLAARHEVDRHVGLGDQRVEVVEVGDARDNRHRHLDAGAVALFGRALDGQGVLGRQAAGVGEIGHHAEARRARSLRAG